ncbi:MAG: DUF2339 domain-containing protein [Chloroflexota bacterium]
MFASEPAPEPSAGPKDLRKLQAAATADVPFVRPLPTPAPSEPLIDLRDIEERLAGRALALVGGAALLLGAVFFLSLAFSRGWIGPEMQVALGLAGGSIGLLVGGFLLFRGERIVGHVLTAVGLAVISLSLFAATSLYELAEPPAALLGVFLAAGVATFIAVRGRSQVVAGFGLAAAMAAPPVMGAEPDLLTVAYMAVALVGIAVVSLWQTWPWLPPLAFVLSAPQLYQWIATEPEATLSVVALLGYWTVLTVAAGGEAFRSARRALSITSAPLFLVVGATVTGLAFIALEADAQRAAFLLTLAALHGLVTAFFAARRGLLDPFGLLAGAYGIAMASGAVPLLLDAPATAVVWTAEAAALALFAGRRAHGPALITATILFTIASVGLAYEALLLSPLADIMQLDAASGSVEGVVAAFVFLVAASVVSMITVPVRAFQLVLAGLVGLAAVPLTYLLVNDAVTVAAWMAIAVIATGAPRWIRYLPERRIRWRLGPALQWIRPTQDTAPIAAYAPLSAAAIATGLAFAGTLLLVIDQGRLPEVPFTDQAGLATLALAGGFAAMGVVAGGAANLRRGLFAAGLVIGVVSITQIASPRYVLVWTGLAVGAALMSRVDAAGVLSYRRMAFGALAVLAVLAFVEAPPDRLVVEYGGVPPHPLLASEASLGIGSLALALAVVAGIGYRHWPRTIVVGLAALAGSAILYLLSVGTVDVFAGEAYGLRVFDRGRLDELVKEAQVALSVLWTAVGVVVLGAGLILRQAELRIAGLAVLGLATVKVFLVDLSSLDVAYRVITLIVLGLLLIVSAYAWSRMKPGQPSGRAGGHGRVDGASHDAHARP